MKKTCPEVGKILEEFEKRLKGAQINYPIKQVIEGEWTIEGFEGYVAARTEARLLLISSLQELYLTDNNSILCREVLEAMAEIVYSLFGDLTCPGTEDVSWREKCEKDEKSNCAIHCSSLERARKKKIPISDCWQVYLIEKVNTPPS